MKSSARYAPHGSSQCHTLPAEVSRDRAFTLVEVLIVVVILGILAAMVVPMAANASSDAQISATITEIKTLKELANRYHLETGEWPPDEGPGVVPAALLGSIQGSEFSIGSPVGGVYDWDVGYGPFSVAMSINDPSPPVDLWLQIDEIYDDGDLNTGQIRRHGNNLQFRVAP